MIKYVDGLAVEMTPEEIAEFEADRASWPVPVPTEVARWRAVRVLRRTADPATDPATPATCWDTVEALLEAMPESDQKVDVDEALHQVLSWERDSPTLNAMAAAAGWDDAFVDELFRAAVEIRL